MDQFYESNQQAASKFDKGKDWRNKSKAGLKPLAFNENDVLSVASKREKSENAKKI